MELYFVDPEGHLTTVTIPDSASKAMVGGMVKEYKARGFRKVMAKTARKLEQSHRDELELQAEEDLKAAEKVQKKLDRAERRALEKERKSAVGAEASKRLRKRNRLVELGMGRVEANVLTELPEDTPEGVDPDDLSGPHALPVLAAVEESLPQPLSASS